MGGIIPIECFYWPSNNFMDLKLTGLLRDVMEEYECHRLLAWKLTEKIKIKLPRRNLIKLNYKVFIYMSRRRRSKRWSFCRNSNYCCYIQFIK